MRARFWIIFYLVFDRVLKDTQMEKTPSNKTAVLSKSMNVDIWLFGTSAQLFITGSYTETKFSKA